jgi:trimeric autotransporter adhesin
MRDRVIARIIRFGGYGSVAAVLACAAHAQAPVTCPVLGTVSAGRTTLPGVVLSLARADGATSDRIDVTSSAIDGTFALKSPGTGAYTLKAELIGFAPITRTVTIDASQCPVRVDVTMELASRSAPRTAAPAAPATPPLRAARQQQSFRSLELVPDQTGLSRADEGEQSESAAQSLLPPGFSPEAATETVATIGAAQQATVFGPGGAGGFGDGFGGPRDGAVVFGNGGAFGAGGRGGGPGGFDQGFGGGGFGGGFGGPFGRGRGNQIRGNVSMTFDSSAFDAAPATLKGQPANKASYLTQRYTATIGGPLTIPKIVNSPRTFFFVNYTGNHSNNPYDAFSTVPTVAERSGDLSALGVTILDPTTHLPFPGSRIPASRLDPSAQQLLNLFPLPNQPGQRQNFHFVTSANTQLDDVNVRVVHAFSPPPPQGRGQGQGPGAQRGPGGGGRGGFGGGRGGGASNLSVNVHYRHSDSANLNPLPTVGGSNVLTAWDIPVSYSFTKRGWTNSIRFDFNHQRANTQNLYAFGQDVASQAGILGASTDPFDWGAPGLSFSSFSSLRDVAPSTRTDRTIAIGDSLVKTRGTHTLRFGGDYRDIRSDSRVDPNARGSFVFTGLYTHLDFADFLLGLPQQSTVQYGPGLERFRSDSWDLFIQDDWRATSKLTVNAGLRYEYYSPAAEAGDRLVTLDAPPDFTAAVPVIAGGTGPFSGPLPDTLVRADRTDLAPRTGIAWRPSTSTIIRAGYGINYNASVYQTIAQQLAGQPPFATAATVLATAAAPVPLSTALVSANPAVTANTFGVDPNMRLPLIQIWNVSMQRDLTRTVTMDIGYVGTRGSRLTLVRAPNRNPDGSLRIEGVAPFLWESSAADSELNAMTVRFRKRMSHGFAAAATYTLAKSIDDASSIGGTAVVVAQNDLDLAAERGLSSFDQRHRFSAEATYDLPFGEGQRWLQTGAGAAILGRWQINTNVQVASGTPFTARVLSDVRDVATGVNGTLRANYSGEPIDVSDPTAAHFFNTAAFSIPLPGTFGNAGRNTIIGPGLSNVSLALLRTIPLGQTRTLAIQIQANNVFNTVQFATIDTVVNSPTFGEVTAFRQMRRVQIVTRLRF